MESLYKLRRTQRSHTFTVLVSAINYAQTATEPSAELQCTHMKYIGDQMTPCYQEYTAFI